MGLELAIFSVGIAYGTISQRSFFFFLAPKPFGQDYTVYLDKVSWWLNILNFWSYYLLEEHGLLPRYKSRVPQRKYPIFWFRDTRKVRIHWKLLWSEVVIEFFQPLPPIPFKAVLKWDFPLSHRLKNVWVSHGIIFGRKCSKFTGITIQSMRNRMQIFIFL